jgi:hypothetical protein
MATLSDKQFIDALTHATGLPENDVVHLASQLSSLSAAHQRLCAEASEGAKNAPAVRGIENMLRTVASGVPGITDVVLNPDTRAYTVGLKLVTGAYNNPSSGGMFAVPTGFDAARWIAPSTPARGTAADPSAEEDAANRVQHLECRGRVFTAVSVALCSPSEFAGEGTPSYMHFEVDQAFCDRMVEMRNLTAAHGFYDVRDPAHPTWIAEDLRTESDVVEVDHFGTGYGTIRFGCYEKNTDLRLTSDSIHFDDLQKAIDQAVEQGNTVFPIGNLEEFDDAIEAIPCIAVSYRTADGQEATAYIPEHRLPARPDDPAKETFYEAAILAAFSRATGLPSGCHLAIDRDARYSPVGELLVDDDEEEPSPVTVVMGPA